MDRTKSRHPAPRNTFVPVYRGLLQSVVELLEEARRFSARSVNAVMTATYWEIGRRIVECEQGGRAKAEYGERLIELLAKDLTGRFGRGFSRRNLFQIRLFYLAYRDKVQTLSAQSGPMDRAPGGARTVQIPSAQSPGVPRIFPLPWSHYVRLLAVDRPGIIVRSSPQESLPKEHVPSLPSTIRHKLYAPTSQPQTSVLSQSESPSQHPALSRNTQDSGLPSSTQHFLGAPRTQHSRRRRDSVLT